MEALTITENFPDLPPFPDNAPTAPLLSLSLKSLLDSDQTESKRFFDACKDIGFFYLDLRGTEVGESLLNDADRLFRVGVQFFDLPVEEKSKYDFSVQKSYFGYKGYGANVVDKQGSLDRNEFYNVFPRTSSRYGSDNILTAAGFEE
jgi:isopenicillin N synthase-like dioxygenase